MAIDDGDKNMTARDRAEARKAGFKTEKEYRAEARAAAKLRKRKKGKK